ncbi:MAG: DUF3238 domain-containing protein [Erythrobacter sp.]|nr:DUF3238 domain-containing protein [Erythrobacter sp.]
MFGNLDNIHFLIGTAIHPPDPQVGVKSGHVIELDFKNRQINSDFFTGHTVLSEFYAGREHIPKVGKLPAHSNAFTVTNVNWFRDGVEFKASGHTETLLTLKILPGIDYEMTFKMKPDGTGMVKGAHDGYPAYEIKGIMGKDTKRFTKIYSYMHGAEELWRLSPPLDVNFMKGIRL